MNDLFDLIVARYVNVGAGQYMHDFRIAHRYTVNIY